MKKEFIIVAAVILCIAVLFTVLNGSVEENEFTDDLNYNATFLNLNHFPVIVENETSGEEIIMSNSDFNGIYS